MVDSKKIKEGFLKGELLDDAVYSAIAKSERSKELRDLLQKLADEEKVHIKIWRSLIGDGGKDIKGPVLFQSRVRTLTTVKKLLGNAFVMRLLEGNEGKAFRDYSAALKGTKLSAKEKSYTREIINDEKRHETALAKEVAKRGSELSYMQSTILGLNDGLVEILAVIAGIATVATTSFIVVILGLIAGISGTFSMAGGVYLSSKSKRLVETALETKKGERAIPPGKEAYHTGIYYFIGAMIAVLPFILGLKGTVGIIVSIVLVSVTLIVASAIVATISGTSVRRRSLEMLAVSLGAALVTILFGTFAKIYFGVHV